MSVKILGLRCPRKRHIAISLDTESGELYNEKSKEGFTCVGQPGFHTGFSLGNCLYDL